MKKIKAIRLNNQLTMREVSKYLNVSESTVSLLENGHRQLTAKYLKKLAQLYNCKIDDLID